MAGITFISTDKAPAAIGPYSQAVEVREGKRTLYVSGQIPLDPATGGMVQGGAAEQAEQALKNLDAVLVAAGMARWNVVKATVFLADMADFQAVNQVYADFFGDHRPARAAVQVGALPKGALVEIEAVAVV